MKNKNLSGDIQENLHTHISRPVYIVNILVILGTSLYYQPGVLHGGEIDHDCSLQRGIGYYLEMLICLAPFCKKSILATLKGITSESNDPSVSTTLMSTYLLEFTKKKICTARILHITK